MGIQALRPYGLAGALLVAMTACTVNLNNPSATSPATAADGSGAAAAANDANAAAAPGNPSPADFADPALGACGAFALEEDASVFHMVADQHYTWEPGTTLNVVFMDGKTENMRAVARVAREWTRHANIDFAFFEPGANVPAGPQIRVSFQRSGYWSLIGSQAAYRDASIPTMNLHFGLFDDGAQEIQRVVLHEFGHVLGLWHEHQNPNIDFTWNKEYIYDYYKRTHNWSRATVDSNIFDALDPDRVDATSFDTHSIMVYSFPRDFTVERVRIEYNHDLSDTDRREIAALYPGRSTPDAPQPPDPTPDELARWAAAVDFTFVIESDVTSQRIKNYAISVAAPPEILARIDHVLYQRQHDTFREYTSGSYYRSAERAHRFGFGWQGWGWVPIKAKVVWNTGQVTEHMHRQAPVQKKNGPDWAAIKRDLGFRYTMTAPQDKWSTYRVALADPDMAEHIHWIEYQRQHDTFGEYARQGYIRQSARDDDFALSWRGYGWVQVAAQVHFKDGTTVAYQVTDAPERI